MTSDGIDVLRAAIDYWPFVFVLIPPYALVIRHFFRNSFRWVGASKARAAFLVAGSGLALSLVGWPLFVLSFALAPLAGLTSALLAAFLSHRQWKKGQLPGEGRWLIAGLLASVPSVLFALWTGEVASFW